MTAEKYDVFISYARDDYKDKNNKPLPNNVISKITSAFRENRISYWIDEDGIYTGDNFAPKIAAAIQESSVFVFVSTQNSNSSRWVQREVAVANDYKKPILPIKCDESVYSVDVIMYLAMLDYCDYRNSPETAIKKLVESVKERLPISQPPQEHSSNKGDYAYKENIIKSLDQIVATSHIAVSRILESNERNIARVNALATESMYNLVESEKEHFESLHAHLQEINDNTIHELKTLSSGVHMITMEIENAVNDIRKLYSENVEQQRKTNILLEQMISIHLKREHDELSK